MVTEASTRSHMSPSREGESLLAALSGLAEVGYDALSMDLVVELVVAAIESIGSRRISTSILKTSGLTCCRP